MNLVSVKLNLRQLQPEESARQQILELNKSALVHVNKQIGMLKDAKRELERNIAHAKKR